MGCNCNNTNNDVRPRIKHVFGNILRLAIPLTLREVEVVDGDVVTTDTDFIPSSNYPVKMMLGKGATKIGLDVIMRNGNIAYVEDKGSIPVGTYSITITCYDNAGNPFRFKKNKVLEIVDTTIEADIKTPIEFETLVWYLDAAMFISLKGEDGVGIEDILTDSSDEVGGMNTITFLLTNGESRSFTIMNGSGSVDNELNINSGHPIANRVVAAKFNEVDGNFEQVFGQVDYDSLTKRIRFFAKGKEKNPLNVIASLDARPFIKDGMVNSVYISNNTLVITFNTDAGREAIGVPLSSVFDPNNYYNKTQVDNRLNQITYLFTNYYNKSQIDTMLSNLDVDGYAELNEHTGKLKHGQASAVVLDAIVFDNEEPPVEEGAGVIYGAINGHIIACVLEDVDIVNYDLGVARHLVFTNKRDNKQYRWTGSAWQQVGGSSGINATYDSNNERIIFTTGSAVVVNERLIITT